ncbi:uncharacterized protein LOC144071771 [Stigmatopora argus]
MGWQIVPMYDWDWLFVSLCPGIGWSPIQGVSFLVPILSWDRFRHPRRPLWGYAGQKMMKADDFSPKSLLMNVVCGGFLVLFCFISVAFGWFYRYEGKLPSFRKKGEKKKKKKRMSGGGGVDTLQEQRKNKKEMEFEIKLAKEKEEMYEREKQLKINRLVQEVSETEREDLEESEKVQHWVECLCQTRLEQISCVESESPELSPPLSPPSEPRVKRFPGGLRLPTTDLDDIDLDGVDRSPTGPPKRAAAPATPAGPPPLPLPPPSPNLRPERTPSRKPPSASSGGGWSRLPLPGSVSSSNQSKNALLKMPFM